MWFSAGGHLTGWPQLVETWLGPIGMISKWGLWDRNRNAVVEYPQSIDRL